MERSLGFDGKDGRDGIEWEELMQLDRTEAWIGKEGCDWKEGFDGKEGCD